MNVSRHGHQYAARVVNDQISRDED